MTNPALMHLSIACPTTPLTGLGGAIARRLQQICQSFRLQHRGLRQLQKLIEKVKLPAFSDCLSPRKPWKAMRFLYSTTSTAELLRPLEL